VVYPVRIEKIEITAVGGIEHLLIPFDPSMNILCGPNGIGKTTVLESVAHCFAAGETSILKRHVGKERSTVTATVQHETLCADIAYGFEEFEPSQRARISGKHDWSPFLLSLKTTRTFVYTPLQAVSRDTEKGQHNFYEEAKTGVILEDVKNWFVNRYLYSAHECALTQEKLANFALAQRCFAELNPDYTFSHVDAATNEILVSTPAGYIYYEYLSSGFKSCLSILFGIIKEVEFRFTGTPIRVEDFTGVVLIDELELHLHPEWQARIAGVLTRIFPMIQFIVTTHSPHIIQAAEPNQIIALEFRDRRVALRSLPQSPLGFKGWTLDEVLTDVMGMHDTRTEALRDLLDGFAQAVADDDYTKAEQIFCQLDRSLHPENHIRKLLRLQLNSITPIEYDPA
jgi:hypothetical protein